MKSAKGRSRNSKEGAITARPVSDDGSPVAVAPSNGVGARGAVGLFTAPRPSLRPALDDVSPRFFGPQHSFENRVRRGMGWLHDTPDIRDLTIEKGLLIDKNAKNKDLLPREAKKSDSIEALTRMSRTVDSMTAKSSPARVDNSKFCSPVEDQGQLGSCTANACVGLVEYMERRASGQHTEGSRLFIYKATRKLLGWTGDTGAHLRTTMKALVCFGVPPENVWPYEVSTFDQEPDPFMYAFAANTKAINYLRLDAPGGAADQTLSNIKNAVARGYAVMFGFSVYSCLTTDPDIPYPTATDAMSGGHAVLIVGYDDARPCCQGASREKAGKGALRIRNSWGPDWGDGGYGWLPYEYVLHGLADDFWTCFQLSWVESGKFD